LRRPISTTELRTLLDNLTHVNGHAVLSAPTTFGSVVTFISNKGGVGKSTLAVNTAVGLAQRYPGRVLLIDGSSQMGAAAALLEVQPESTTRATTAA
jgi:pilus assembly protein CpaE